MGTTLEEDVTALSIGIIAEPVKEHHRPQKLFIRRTETKVVVLWVVFNELLKRPRAVWAVLTKYSERDEMKPKRLGDQIRSDLAGREAVFGEIPERLLSA